MFRKLWHFILCWCAVCAEAFALVQLRADSVSRREKFNPFAYVRDAIRSATQRRSAPQEIIEKSVPQEVECPAVQLLIATDRENKSKNKKTERLFPNSDFEKGSQFNWHAEGDAFIDQPTKGDNTKARGVERCNLQGKFWIGTFEAFTGHDESAKAGAAHGEGATGTLTSVPFTLKKRYITFLVGGGGADKGVGVKLHSPGGDNILLTTGLGGEKMKRVSFDACKYVGEEIQLGVFDNAAGGEMGHINVDDFRQSNEVMGKQIWEPALADNTTKD